MGQGLAGRGAASGPAIVAGKRSGRAITQAKAKAGSQEANEHSGAQTSLADVKLLSARHSTAVYTQRLIFGAFETPEWATFGLCRCLRAPLRSKNHHIAP